MMVNIENVVRHLGGDDEYQDGYKYMLTELIAHLKELRDRTDAGDMSALDEFFDLYRFSDPKSREIRTKRHTQHNENKVATTD